LWPMILEGLSNKKMLEKNKSDSYLKAIVRKSACPRTWETRQANIDGDSGGDISGCGDIADVRGAGSYIVTPFISYRVSTTWINASLTLS